MVENGASAEQDQQQQGQQRKPMKALSKAERRKIQEEQRARKAAAREAGGTGAGNSSKGGVGASSGGAAASTSLGGGNAGTMGVGAAAGTPTTPTPTTANPAAIPGEHNNPSAVSTSATATTAPFHTTSFIQQQNSAEHALFGHLDPPRSARALFPIKGYVHPSVLALAVQYTDMKIVGANARCIAMLDAFKDVIKAYVAPPGTSLNRHLPTYLSPQINHLVKARPMATSMGNAIRFLKNEITNLSSELPDEDAKTYLCEKIDHFKRDRIFLAGKVIEELAITKIQDGDVVLTYARSSLVEGTLIEAKRRGKDFSVVIVDGKPMLEGKKLLAKLVSEDIPTSYVLVGSIGSVLANVTLVLLGTQSVLSNGSLYARAGTAMVAMTANAHGKPVVCCCETYKFSDRIMLDSISDNERASIACFPSSHNNDEEGSYYESSLKLEQEMLNSNVHQLNLLYDVTRPQDVTCVICEVAIIPPQSAPVAMRDYKPIVST